MNHINLIREKQHQVFTINHEIHSLQKQFSDESSLQDVISEGRYNDEYYGANELAHFLTAYEGANKNKLTDIEKESLIATANLLKDIQLRETNTRDILIKSVKAKQKQKQELNNEIIQLIKDDHGFQEEYTKLHSVNLEHVQEFLSVIFDTLKENGAKYNIVDRKKLVFDNGKDFDVDMREVVQAKIRETEPHFNFKSLATNQSYKINEETMIELLYLS